MVAHARSSATQFQLIPASIPLLPGTPLLVELLPPAKGPRPVIVPDPPPLPTGESEEVRWLRSSLEAAIAAKLTNGSELIRALAKQRRHEVLSTTIAPLDALLGGGLSRGKMTEIAGLSGRFSIVMATLAAATSIGEAAALIDLGDHFDPQLGEAAGIDLRRLLWIRPHTMKQAVTAAEMLGATGFQLIIIDAGIRRKRPSDPATVNGERRTVNERPTANRESRSANKGRVADATWVRLARVAETHGCAIVVSAPFALTGTTSEAMVLASGSRARWLGNGRSPRVLAGVETRVRLEKHRRLRPGHSAAISFRAIDALVRGERRAASGEAVAAEGFADRGPRIAVNAARTKDFAVRTGRIHRTSNHESREPKTANPSAPPAPDPSNRNPQSANCEPGPPDPLQQRDRA